LCPRKVAADAR